MAVNDNIKGYQSLGATLALQWIKIYGIQITFQNPGEDALTLNALVLNSSRGAGVWADVDAYHVTLMVPRQDVATTVIFPPTSGILTGATVIFNSRRYAIENAVSDFGDIVDAVSVTLELRVLSKDDTVAP
jgi:hypothetical protein